jgi:hypothetical protein
MVQIRRLSDPPKIFKEMKTTIKDGNICRVPVWKDTLENEYEQVGKRFVPKHQAKLFPVQNNIEFQMVEHEDTNDTLFAFLCFSIIVLSITFLTGFIIGSTRILSTKKKLKKQTSQPTKISS